MKKVLKNDNCFWGYGIEPEFILTAEQFCLLQESVGFGKPDLKQSEICLRNSLYSLSVEIDNKIVGMGRIVGDGAVICYVQDLIVVPDEQHKGIGSMVLKKLVEYVKSLHLKKSQMMLCLMCAKGREPFYENHGFIARPTKELGPGMIQYLRDY